MKKNLFLSRVLAATVVSSVTFCSYSAYAGIMHSDATIQTYTDFGQNCGRYVVGNKVNALLSHIRSEAGGITISYTDGQADRVVMDNEQGMIDFSAMFDCGAKTAIAPNMVVSVNHMWSIDGSFAERLLGADKAINYKAIDNGGSSLFRIAPDNNDGTGKWDYMLARQSKIITDATLNPFCTLSTSEIAGLEGEFSYRAGSGAMQQRVDGVNQGLVDAYVYITGGIDQIDGFYAPSISVNEETGNFTLSTHTEYWHRGADNRQPLPNAGLNGDSGSPMYIYNEKTKSYELIAAFQSCGNDGYGWGHSRGNLDWTVEQLKSYNEYVNLSGGNVVYLNAVNTKGETVTDGTNTADIIRGVATDAANNTIATYQGVQAGVNTWGNLSGIKNDDYWYAYDNSYLSASIYDLFFTENLVFTPTEGENTIILNDTVDLGIGYAEFNKAESGSSAFTIKSATGETNVFNHAGYVINEGATVHLQLKNKTNHMTEWRKIGAGTLVIDGTGDTNALVTVGGSGATILNQSNGYAAYNVLANTGATVQILGGINQIKRDFTFGAGGGTLDMYGHSMTWNNNNGAEADGFTIHALTEEAIITSTHGTSTLTITDAGTEFLGSFKDSENGALKVIYNGNGTLTMHSIHTRLSNSFEVQSGHVILSGTNTVHGLGSLDGTSAARNEKTNDWHYADATMDVAVTCGIFELGSHARLTGDVTVATGGTYIMREGVLCDQEFVEGGANLEDVSKYAAYYGHKGNVSLAKNANLQIAYNSGATAYNEYAGNISGEGNVTIALKNDGATLNLSGSAEVSSLKVDSGNVLLTGETINITGGYGLEIQSGANVAIGSSDLAPTINTYCVFLGTLGGESSANLTFNSGRINIGDGGIAINSSAVVTVNGGTLGTSAELWETNQAITVAGNLTVDTQRVDVQDATGGTIKLKGEISGGGGITKIGLGNLELSGTVNLQRVEVLSGSLSMTGSASVDGHVSIAQGANFSMKDGYTLGADDTLTVVKSAQGGSAQLNSLVVDGGTLMFDASSLPSDVAALSLVNLSGTEANVSFTNTSNLKTGFTYALANGDWASVSVSGTGSSYLTPEFDTSSGLTVSFTTKSGYILWTGQNGQSTWSSEEFAQEGAVGTNVAVFNSSAAVKTVTVSEAVSAGGILFDTDSDYTFTGEGNITTGSFDMNGTGRVEVNTELAVTTTATISGTLEINTGVLSANSAVVKEGATLVLRGSGHSIGALNASSGMVQLDSASLNLGANTHHINSLSTGGDSAIHLASGAILHRIREVSGTVNLTGSGTYILGAGKTTLVDSGSLSLHAPDWTGTVELTSAVSTQNTLIDLNLNDYGNIGSTVKLVGVLGSLMAATGESPVTFACNLKLQNNSWAGLELNRGNDGDSFIFSGDITGNGNFVKNNRESQSFTFSGDVSGWNGNYRIVTGENHLTFNGDASTINLTKIYTEANAVGTTTVTFSNENAVTVNSIISQNADTVLNVVADAAGGTTFTKQVTVGNLTVSSGSVNLNASSNNIGMLSAAGVTITLASNTSLTLGGFVEGGNKGTQFTLNSGSNLILNNAGTINFNNHDNATGAKTTGSGMVTIGNGTTVQLTNSAQKKEAAIDGVIKVQGGGSLELSGNKSLLGYDDGATDTVYLSGSEGMLATMRITSTGAQHLSTNLYLQGNAQVTGDGTIESYQSGQKGKIYAEGTNNTISANINLNRTLTIDVASRGELNVSGTIGHIGSGPKNLIKTGDGTLIISSANTYTAGTSINSGILKLGNATALGRGPITVNEGGTLDVNGVKETTYAVTLAGGATLQNTGSNIGTGIKQIANITLSGDATVTGSANFAMIAGNHAQASLDLAGNTLTKTGNNTFSISNTAVTAGTLKVNQGTLQAMMQNSTDYLDISAVTVAVGRVDGDNVGTFRLSGNSEAIKALTFDGGKVSVDKGNRLTVNENTAVTSNGGTLQGMVELNTISFEGALNMGNGTDTGVVIRNLDNQVGTIEGSISLVVDNTSIGIAGLDTNNKAIVADTLIDIMKGSTLNMSNIVLQDSSRVTDNPATFNVNNVVAQVTIGKNATTTAEGRVLNITSSLIDSVSVTGSDFTIALSGDVDLTAYDYVSITFNSYEEGATAASFATDMNITLQYAGNEYDVYFVEGNTTTLYAAIPEPGTATLSLLALAALAARRRRK